MANFRFLANFRFVTLNEFFDQSIRKEREGLHECMFWGIYTLEATSIPYQQLIVFTPCKISP